jgi:hypothetical protein
MRPRQRVQRMRWRGSMAGELLFRDIDLSLIGNWVTANPFSRWHAECEIKTFEWGDRSLSRCRGY